MKLENTPSIDIKLFDQARTLGTRIVAEAGTGKSALMAWITFADFLKGIPVVVWDHNGGLIDNFFKLVETSRFRSQLRPRIRYIEMGNVNFAYGLPFYYDTGRDDPFTMSQRIIDVMIKLDPEIRKAPIMGESSLTQIATAVGMILAATVDEEGNRWQITEALDLLLHFKEPRWLRIRENALRVDPRVESADKFFRESYTQWSEDDRRDRRYVFEARLWPYLQYAPLRAMVGQGKPSINWPEVNDKNLAVIFDFRHLQSEKPLEQLSLMTFNSFLEYVKLRGINAAKPISMIIDELPALLEFQSLEADIRQLSARFRAFKLWPVLGHQTLNQLSPTLRESSWSFRNQIIGQQANSRDAEDVVRNLLAAIPATGLPYWGEIIQKLPARQFMFKRSFDEATPDLKVHIVKRTPDIPALMPNVVSEEQVAAAKLRNQIEFAPRVPEVLQTIKQRLEVPKSTPQPKPKA